MTRIFSFSLRISRYENCLLFFFVNFTFIEMTTTTGVAMVSGGRDVESLGDAKRGQFAKAPDWRNIRAGMNIMGKCVTARCEAVGEFAICQFGMAESYISKLEVLCPKCKQKMDQPYRIRFYNCWYKISGWAGRTAIGGDWKKIEGNEYDTVGEGQAGEGQEIKVHTLMVATRALDNPPTTLSGAARF
jgi:hypothetical protein